MTRIEDEAGKFYWVDKGDPAYHLLQKLHSRHFFWIVLPREIIMGWETLKSKSWCGYLTLAQELGYDSPGGRRSLRLAECLQALGG
jgi:hypothetical protein